jgi:hypothetical protein
LRDPACFALPLAGTGGQESGVGKTRNQTAAAMSESPVATQAPSTVVADDLSQTLAQAEARVAAEILRVGPGETYRTLLAEYDALIREANLDNGRQLAAGRTALHTELARHWVEAEVRAQGYDRPFALVALGGTGRAELTPYSDLDFALLVDDAVEDNRFLLRLQHATLKGHDFERTCGFSFTALAFNLDDAARQVDKQLNSFLDLRPVYDPHGLAETFRQRIRLTFDPFEHFLHVRTFWKSEWEKAACDCERAAQFDIKNDGLRVFLAGIWTLAGERFVHSHDIYRQLADPRDLQAYYLLLRLRAWIHSRRGPAQAGGNGRHPQDVLGFDDFLEFGAMLGSEADEDARFAFANEVRARLLSARRRVARFTKGIIERELKLGRRIGPRSPIVMGVGGLSHTGTAPGADARERSRAAMSLVLASQHYGVPIDPAELEATFRDAGDWLVRVPELAALFYESRGSLADSFAFLAQFDGAEDRLFPGHARFEVSVDARMVAERRCLRGAFAREKLRDLDKLVREGRERIDRAVSATRANDPNRDVDERVEAARLGADELAAVRLALKTKRLPLTPGDVAWRQNQRIPREERFASGFSDIPLADYYEPYAQECEFPPETLRLAQFLVAHRRTFKDLSGTPNDTQKVREFCALCSDERHLRALYVFTCADRAEWESAITEPSRWFNIGELCIKAISEFRPPADPTRALADAGFAPDQQAILKDLGPDLYSGVYRRHASRFGEHLVRLSQEGETTGPKAALLHHGTSRILGVAARDYRGLAATISGALRRCRVRLSQAHLFSAMNYGLALDFFHIAAGDAPVTPEVPRAVEDAIRRHLHIADADEAEMPRVPGVAILQEWRTGLYCLRFETRADSEGLLYALTYRVYRYLRGNIFALSAHSNRGDASISVYHSLPNDLSLADAQKIVAEMFG